MTTLLHSLLVYFLFKSMFMTSKADKETIIEVPNKNSQGKWIWSWTSQWTKKDGGGKVFYQVCDVSSDNEPNKWIRSNVFRVGDAKRIDVTVQYAVSKCSSVPSLQYCKETLNLYVYKTAIQHTISNLVPEPWKKPNFYHIFGTTSPTNRSTGILSRNFANTEKHSFLTNPSTPYHYFAIQYRGGCFELYSVTISYSVCPSLALPTGLVQLPRTIAPANGTIKVSGKCPENAQPLANNATLYGHCQANGQWRSDVGSTRCWCRASYGNYLNGPGAVCKDCPIGTYQNSPSGSACKPCPLNSVQDVDRKKCNCKPLFYRTDIESAFDNCTGQPSEPQSIMAISKNATFITLQWSTPSKLGGRSDTYYNVRCKKCNNEGKNCTAECTGAFIFHAPTSSMKATVHHLSAYTYYLFEVFAKNGVSPQADKKGDNPKYSVLLSRTGESTPGPAVVTTVKILNATTVFLSWTVPEPNGAITYYEVIYYPVGQETEKETKNTTSNNITINGLIYGKEYIFKVRASTNIGFGISSNITKTIVLPNKGSHTGEKGSPTELILGIVIGVSLLIALVCVIVVIFIYRHRKRKEENSPSNDLIPMASERLFIDPSNYNSPLEAMRSHTNEIELKNLELKINIGEGEFADVYKGIYITGSNREVVAVKILKPTSSTKNKKDFIREASIMGQFKHPNVIELKGVVTRSPEYPMMIVTEFMENGSLDHFLKSRDGMLTPLQLVGIARGVANGMAYLTDMCYVHRDLAARNILLTENFASKISDFGLSRELYTSEDNPESVYMTQGGKIPIRWTAPEAIRYRKYSSASDVWSFGILLWEIMAFAKRPYWDWENEEVFTRVEGGFRLPPPMYCPKSIHDLMLECWEKDMNSRPKFPDIVKRLDEMIRSPDKMNHQEIPSQSVGAQTNLGELTSVEEWLIDINMRQYGDKFVDAGLTELYQITLLDDKALKRIGITLIGHRNKIYKSICKLRQHFTAGPDIEITI